MSIMQYIGHGRMESSPENFSILHVLSHELTHVQEFKKEANRNNEDIVDIRVKLDLEMLENGKIVAVSGETSALKRKVNDESKEKLFYSPNQKPKNSVLSSLGENINQLQYEADDYNKDYSMDLDSVEKSDSSNKSPEDFQIVSRKEYLESRLKQVEIEINTIDNKTSYTNYTEIAASSLDHKSKDLEREKRIVEEELRLIRLEEETKKNFQFLAKISREKIVHAFEIASNDKKLLTDNLDIQV